MDEEIDVQELANAKESETDVSKCPRCGANLKYDPESLTLLCEYCNYSQKVDYTHQAEEIDFANLLKTKENWNEAHAFVCNNCGARQVLDRKEIAKTCVFCGTSNIVESKDLCGLKPNAILPFLINQDSAVEKVHIWAKKRPLAPRRFKKSITTEQVRGNYSPAFTFDADTFSRYEAKLGKTEVKTVYRNGKTYTHTETKWFYVSGTYSKHFNDVLIQASDTIEQKTVNKLAPFETDYSRKYANEFLHGFSASQYSKDGMECYKEARNVMQKTVESLILSRYTYDKIAYMNCDMACSGVTYKYLLIPIYVGHFNYNKKLYNFFVNGQNGKVTGKTPLSPIRVGLVVLGILAVIGLAALLFYFYQP